MTMRRAMTILSLPGLVLLGGCYQDEIDAGAKLVSITEGDWDTYVPLTTGETPTTSTGPDEQPDTSTSGDTGTPPDLRADDLALSIARDAINLGRAQLRVVTMHQRCTVGSEPEHHRLGFAFGST